MDLNQVERQLIELETRFNEWRYPITKEEWDKQRRRDELTVEWKDYERDRDELRQKMGYDPHAAFVPIFDELCDYYLTATDPSGKLSARWYCSGVITSSASKLSIMLKPVPRN